jgi:fumarate reductase subunit C
MTFLIFVISFIFHVASLFSGILLAKKDLEPSPVPIIVVLMVLSLFTMLLT